MFCVKHTEILESFRTAVFLSIPYKSHNAFTILFIHLYKNSKKLRVRLSWVVYMNTNILLTVKQKCVKVRFSQYYRIFLLLHSSVLLPTQDIRKVCWTSSVMCKAICLVVWDEEKASCHLRLLFGGFAVFCLPALPCMLLPVYLPDTDPTLLFLC